MSSNDFILFSLQITAMLGCAVVFGQLMRRFNQPAVLGEMIGGILLGPTLLGALAPGLFEWLFQSSTQVTAVREASIKLGMLFFLFVAGLEVNLTNLRRLGRRALLIGLVGTLVPIAVGVGLVYLSPLRFWGTKAPNHLWALALFIGMNLANSANPVIARILMDLDLLKKEIGTVIMTATIVDDLVNWTLFAVILSNFAPRGQVTTSLPLSIALVLVFFVTILGVGRWLGPRMLEWIKRRVSWPTGFIAVTTLVILAAGCLAEKLGLHAFLGAFLVGAAVAGEGQGKDEARNAISHFVLSFFVPIYFVTMGLNANFVTNFDLALVTTLTAFACLSKVGAVLLGAWLAGMPVNRETWAIGFGLNARGATGIILASVGLEYGLIDERIFVAVVVMALATSLLSGPMIKLLTKPVPDIVWAKSVGEQSIAD
jgi:Kef-type K+ transport system membrane component KefB